MAQASSHPSHSPKPAASTPTDEGINKVRDILFGAKIREQNEKFELLQQKLESRLTTLRDEQLERFNVLEKFTKEEMKALTHNLQDEKNERDKAFAKIAKMVDDLHGEIEGRLAYLAADSSKSTSEVRNFVLTCTKDMSEQIHTAHKKFADDINREIRSLNERKLNRLQMAEMLNDWSSQISETPPSH